MRRGDKLMRNNRPVIVTCVRGGWVYYRPVDAQHSLPEVVAESEAHTVLRRPTVGEAVEHMQEGGR